MTQTLTPSKTRSTRVSRGSSNRLSLLLRELKSVAQPMTNLHSFQRWEASCPQRIRSSHPNKFEQLRPVQHDLCSIRIYYR
jgi:hypothetical protein